VSRLLSIANKPFKLSVIMLHVIMLNVVAPQNNLAKVQTQNLFFSNDDEMFSDIVAKGF
jgi:hypothetical protein